MAPTTLPFPPVTKQHILNCSYHSWYPRYRKVTPKSRLIPLTQPFLDYLQADGIFLPDDRLDNTTDEFWTDNDSGVFSAPEDDDEEDADVAANWRGLHDQIAATIRELGSKVIPKLNWSAPKDATWQLHTNSMECSNTDHVYLLLKSSDFITHDLEHPFDDCVGDEDVQVPYHLVLRQYFKMSQAMEFRCFVKDRTLVAISQRDTNYYPFLEPLKQELGRKIKEFFETHLQRGFADANFSFDVYLSAVQENRVYLIDINPWALRTDALRFTWRHLLNIHTDLSTTKSEKDIFEQTTDNDDAEAGGKENKASEEGENETSEEGDNESSEESDSEQDDSSIVLSGDEEISLPIFRLVSKDDPEAYNYSSPQYSAHKLPKDVVDASRADPASFRDFATQWREVAESLERVDLERRDRRPKSSQ